MGSFGNYLEDKLLDHVFGNTAYSAPATIYIGLSKADPLDDGSGIDEPVGGNYSRVAVTNNTTNWPNSVAGAKSNGTAITFPTASAGWGVCTHFFLYTTASGAGNLLGHAQLTNSKTVDSGDTLSFAIGELDLTLD